MENLHDALKERYGSYKQVLEKAYRKNYDEDMTFRKIANDTKLSPEELMKYTTKLEVSACELKNCKKCKNILECKNETAGYVYYPTVNDEIIEFCYLPCKYQKQMMENQAYLKNIMYFDMPKDIRDASMKDIELNDKNQFPVITWIKDFLNGKNMKGLYLNGSFGSGKTFLLSAMLNELAKQGKKVAIIYYPEFLRSLKESFSGDLEFRQKFNYIKKVAYLLLDDIGAETLTEWSRDEILGTILQYRMEEKLPTFFTSNLTITELENHLATGTKQIDKVKAKRIIERVKQLTEEMTLISENKRK